MKYHFTFFLHVKNYFQGLPNDHTPASCHIGTPIWKTFKGRVKREARCSPVPLPSDGSVPSTWRATWAGVRICTRHCLQRKVDLCVWGKSFAAAGMTKWEWTRSAGYSSSRRLWIKCREQSRKFFKSNNHARQITPPSPNTSPPLPDFNSEGNSLCCPLCSSWTHCK